MTPVLISVQNQYCSGTYEPLTFGIPLPQGELHDTSALTLNDAKTSWPLQTSVSALWPDGSIRWLLAHTQRPPEADPEQSNLELALSQRQVQTPVGIHAIERDEEWEVQAGNYKHRLNKSSGQLHSCAADKMLEDSWTLSFGLFDEQVQPLAACLESVEPEMNPGDVLARFRLTGYWKGSKKIRFEYSITIYALGGLVEINYCLHNPNRALHPGGLWDLGDPGSFFFTGLEALLGCSSINNALLESEPGGPTIQSEGGEKLHLYQDSSGGDNWQSLNHVDKDGKVTTRFQCYRITTASDTQSAGLRAQPSLEVQTANEQVCIAMPQFWQNFPSAIGSNELGAQIGLFPRDYEQQYELQGGERKTQRFFVGFGKKMTALTWVAHPTIPILSARHYGRATAFPWFNADKQPGPLDELIKVGLDSKDSFLAKREIIDEYGWRNFGDLLADHETLYQEEGEAPLVSHYNNQYDAIYGFARQFALTGDPRWFELMDDLARHVTDIDIYHTEGDRPEYNHGLFWHTDHYLPAHTATHRTFTRQNNTSSTPGQTGGGPAAEHCYTTGLLFHYFLTGQKTSKRTVVQLADWMITLHDGTKGLLARLWSIKKNELNRLAQVIKGEAPSPYLYPFTRGTGNYITSLVDAFEVTADQFYLNKAEAVIRGTMHFKDDIKQRGLLNVELSWSYLILLSSTERFLTAKNQHEQWDDGFFYAKAALLHYTSWMRKNEKPFLADPDQLEFPNDTWVAQDIRKAMLMLQAAELSPSESELYKADGQAMLNDNIEQLSQSPTRHFARIQIILLQNYGPQSAHQPYKPQAYSQPIVRGEPPKLNFLSLVTSLVGKGVNGLLEFRPAREKAWLRTRLNRS